MKRKFLLAALAAFLTAAVFICAGCTDVGGTDKNEPVNENITVTFVLDKEIVYTQEISKGGKIDEPELDGIEKSPFIVWTCNGTLFDFNKTLKCDTVLTATLSRKFTVTFKADGKTVKTCEYSYYDRTLNEPSVPSKNGYTGEWEEYCTTGGDITVQAVYTPVFYFIDYYINGEIDSSVTCTVENYAQKIPAVPEKYGYTGKWVYEESENGYKAALAYEPVVYTAKFVADGKVVKSVKTTVEEELSEPLVPKKERYDGKWAQTEVNAKDIIYEAVYTPTVYTVSFIGENGLVDELTYTVENLLITPPDVPDKLHYDGRWPEFSLDFEDITVKAEYSPTQYRVTFKADGKIIDERFYTIESPSITQPAFVEKAGFTGEWEKYTLSGGDITVNADYTAIDYYAAFIADGLIVKEVVYTMKDTQIPPPPVPQKNGYTGAWSDYVIKTGGITITADYTPIIYKATFVAEGVTVATLSYTVEDEAVTLPAVPEKEGYKGEWNDFDLTYGDVTIEAKYAPAEYCATFIADGITVARINYNAGDEEITPPAVPEKRGYTGAWQNYELEGNVTVYALYEAIEYTVTFIADENTVSTQTYSVEKNGVTAPAVPEKFGYTAKWRDFEFDGNVTVTAEYTLIKYKVTFVAEERETAVLFYTVENKTVTPPAVPEKDGYRGKWADFDLNFSDITVEAEYAVADYCATFVAEGVVVARIKYSAFDEEITPPAVPEKYGYDGKWQDYELNGDFTVHAEYTETVYEITYMAEGKTVYRDFYTVNDTNIILPSVPAKTGYSGVWEDFTLTCGDVTVNAAYALEIYTVYFIADGKILHKAEYSIENRIITVPEPPAKRGYKSEWQQFELTYENVYVNAVFTQLEGTEGLIYELDGEEYTVTGYKGSAVSLVIPSLYKNLPVTKIADNAFDRSGMPPFAFENITICENVQSVGDGAFYGCVNLKSVSLPDSLTYLGQSAFAGCTALEDIIIPDGVTKIEDGTFTNSGVTGIVLSKNITVIGDNAFNGCSGLKEIVIPDSVKEIHYLAFMNCTSLEKITFGTGLEKIYMHAFTNCPKLSYAAFADPDGWKVKKVSAPTDVSAQFSDPATAAETIFYNSGYEISK